jgi:hypothetical protein
MASSRVSKKLASAACLLALGAGCTTSKYEPLSAAEGAEGIEGKVLTTRSAMLVHETRNGGDKYYVVTAIPGISGPEIISRSELPAGSELKVQGAQRCINCVYPEVRLKIQVAGSSAEPMYLVDVPEGAVFSTSNNQISFSSELFASGPG